ncbi:MAG: metalloregulator ArsR/SmtB family transcription factor [candidate division WOR-3 bacterium]
MHNYAYMNIKDYTAIFKILSVITRLKITWILKKAGKPLCVCEIMDVLKEPHYNVSRHLKELKNVHLVEEKKEGKWVFYSLTKEKDPFIKTLLKTIERIPKKFFTEEEENLKKRLSLRKDNKVVVGLKRRNKK